MLIQLIRNYVIYFDCVAIVVNVAIKLHLNCLILARHECVLTKISLFLVLFNIKNTFTMVFVITVGTKVQGKFGGFLPIEGTNAGQRKARKVRSAIFGTVLKSL